MKSLASWRFSSVIALCCFSLSRGGDNLIINGSFAKGDTGWEYLLQAGAAKATGSVENSEYAIAIQAAGNEAWHVQLRQKGIKLTRGESYRFSFDARASDKRAIEAAVGREYYPYSLYTYPLLSTFALTTTMQKFSTCFTMLDSNDTNARVQFNCGLSAVNVYLDNVSLEKITDSTMLLIAPNGGEAWSSGATQEIRWVGVGMQNVSLKYSPDAGLHWNEIAASAKNTGIYLWAVPKLASPWCLVRVAPTDKDEFKAQSRDPFEIGSYFNYVKNGAFGDSVYSAWNPLGVYGKARARGFFSGGEYRIAVDTAGDEYWNVQFTQNGIPLVLGENYTFSFDAYADAPRPLMANIGQSGEGYQTYLSDTAQGKILLTASKKTYSIQFTMTKPSDVNARIEFNAGTAVGVVHLDNVTLYSDNLPTTLSGPVVSVHAVCPNVTLEMKGAGFARIYPVALRGPVRQAGIFDLRGRLVKTLKSGAMRLRWDCRSDRASVVPSGAYIVRVLGAEGVAAIPVVIP